jgi:signal transduction histidine kinase
MPEPVDILLVDDQPSKLLSYEAILSDMGECLITARTGREALAELLRRDVAVVLLDVQMPDLDGFELAALIREHPRYQETPLIFVSAVHQSEFDRIRGYEAGAVDYVPVPVVPELLRAKVRVFVDLHRKTRELRALNQQLELRVAERTAALEASRAALQAFNDQLEALVAERTRERELALSQLFEAQKVDTIGQLTGGVAHDFNNLLMAVIGSLQILRKKIPDDPKAHRLIENALQGAERGAALTQRLLAFARRQELSPEVVDLRSLLENIDDLLCRALGPTVKLRKRLAPALPPVLMDPNQLELAILNLAVNGRDAMPSGGVLTISAQPMEIPRDSGTELAKGAYLKVTVSDTGSGMDADTLARATEPFFTRKGVGKGTGLGLSMVQGLAVQSGGALRIRSELGRGTDVEIWLPQTAARQDVAPEPDVLAETVEPGPALRILLVDDDPLVRTGAHAMLEDLGHSVIEASSGREALARFGQEPRIDLVITDQAMPEMTGVELAARLAALAPGIPVILATGYAELREGAESGGSDLPRMSKPFLQADLAKMIARCRRSAAFRQVC